MVQFLTLRGLDLKKPVSMILYVLFERQVLWNTSCLNWGFQRTAMTAESHWSWKRKETSIKPKHLCLSVDAGMWVLSPFDKLVASLYLCFTIRYAAGCTFKFTVEEKKQYHYNCILTFKLLENRSEWQLVLHESDVSIHPENKLVRAE